MTEHAQPRWSCPKDGTEMTPMGRRNGAWRCPSCRAMFLDLEAMRRGRRDRPPAWAPVVASVVMSMLVTVIVRRLSQRRKGAAIAES